MCWVLLIGTKKKKKCMEHARQFTEMLKRVKNRLQAFFFFFGNSSKIMLTNCLDKDSGQTPISPAATLTPGALLCGHYISPDAEAVFHPHRLPVSGSSALRGLHAGTRAGRSQYLEFNHSLWQRELALESLSPAVKHLSQKSDSHFCS